MAVNFVERIDDEIPVRHALISVSDKTGLDVFAKELLRLCPEVKLYSTGGTFKMLEAALGAALAEQRLVQISDYTGQPEMQGGLVKTLDFKIYLGLLSETYNDAHKADLARVQAVPIDLVVVNLYPFVRTVAQPDATVEMARANIDIGGPCMLRAAAKNFLRVASLTDPADYTKLIEELGRAGGRLSLATRFDLSRKAFAHTAAYDTAIAEYLAKQSQAVMRGCYQTKP